MSAFASATRTARGGAGALVLALALAGAPAAAADAPPRLVSINLCADALVLLLADRAQILSLSRLAADPAVSPLAAAARGLPANRGSVEEVIRLDPDLVLSGPYRTARTNAVLERFGHRVVVVPPTETVAGAVAAIRAVGTAIGHPGRGAAVADRLAAAFASPAPSRDASALVLRPNAVVSGPPSITSEVVVAAGLADHARRLAVVGWQRVDLERLVRTPPDLLIRDDVDDGRRSWAQRLLAHPALIERIPPERVADLPSRLWLCPGPWLAEALAEVRGLGAALGTAR